MHWFWHSQILNVIEGWLVSLTNYVWAKRRESEKKLVKQIKSKQ